jgi:hypothetical protein
VVSLLLQVPWLEGRSRWAAAGWASGDWAGLGSVSGSTGQLVGAAFVCLGLCVAIVAGAVPRPSLSLVQLGPWSSCSLGLVLGLRASRWIRSGAGLVLG